MSISKIICWWSGGVTSAVACKLAIELFGKDNCRVVFIDTFNEHPDTYRFLLDCWGWYGVKIEIETNWQYHQISDVWDKYNSLNVANGAICSSELKREVRKSFMLKNPGITHQIFGFDIDEPKRAKALTLNYPETNPFYPLLAFAYSKKKCIQILSDAGIEIPQMYKEGYVNNNCYETGCVQGGIWYWKKIKKERYGTYHAMAMREHKYTAIKGSPVTCLRNQTKERKGEPIFLMPHPDYPQYQCLDDKDGREPEPVFECNGFCGTNDLIKQY